ncbi:MAG: uracil-DNA glycosylase [Pseudomonadota bacterium]|nr:uracil-DNA glycosylase [Pseudomonadota bacterium]QKK05763.1 MAG: uracil-DNA glycosylase [Pseudomonadota bacterium]
MSAAAAQQQFHHYVAQDCGLCPRLAAFRADNLRQFPDKFNAPVPSFGADNPSLLIVGLAPGLKGANFSGRPFTGDYAGDTLYAALLKFGFAAGVYKREKDDGIVLKDCRITNAVRCVPPQNKPEGEEIKTCGSFLQQEIADMPRLKLVVALGGIAHNSFLRILGLKQSAYKFGHGALHELPGGPLLLDSYHCSRYNVNTGRLTEEMFDDIFRKVKELLSAEKL